MVFLKGGRCSRRMKIRINVKFKRITISTKKSGKSMPAVNDFQHQYEQASWRTGWVFSYFGLCYKLSSDWRLSSPDWVGMMIRWAVRIES